MKELVKNGDFSNGNSGFTSDYEYINDKHPPSSSTIPNYHVDTSPQKVPGAPSSWGDFGDHTTGDGKMMICDGGPGNVWSEAITLKAGQHYNFELWARLSLNGQGGLGNLPQLQFFADGHAVGSVLTVQGPDTVGWQELKFSYTATATTHVVSIQDAVTDQADNDFCLDDISIVKHGGAGGGASLAERLHADLSACSHSDLHPAFTPMHGAEHLAIA